MTAPEQRRCDECGRPMRKATRVLRGHAYCMTCYVREFKRRPCPRCGRLARLPRREREALCHCCETDEPCVRCKRRGRPIGKVTPYGPACNSCAKYFRTPEQVDASQERASAVGDERARTQPNHGTCSLCRRHRRLNAGADGTMLCERCLRLGMVVCPQCQGAMPAGYGTRCESCYWLETFERRLAQNRALFADDEHERLFAEYAAWLRETRGVKVAALRLDKDAAFFAELATLGGGLPAADVLLARFPPVRLARHRVAMHFLGARHNLHLDANAKRAATERRRIQTLTLELPEKSAGGALIRSFQERLMRNVDAGTLSLRSARLYLRAALGMVQATAARGLDRPDAAAAKRYVSRHHGQKASLYPFLTFLELRMPLDGRAAKTAARDARSRVRAALLARLSKAPAGVLPDEQSVALALQYFHNLSQTDAREIARKHNVTTDGTWIVLRDGETAYHLPVQLGGAVSQ
ncbi:MAG: hypothetical protein ACYDDQ_00465 [Vulcanimicrobiaceae bacterium]